MTLVSIHRLHRRVLQLSAATDPPGGIAWLSCKRDWGISIFFREEGWYLGLEKGFEEQELRVQADGPARVLNTLIKREFSRSRKVRLEQVILPGWNCRGHVRGY